MAKQRRIIAVQHDDLLRAGGLDGRSGFLGLHAHVLHKAHQIAQRGAGGRLVLQHGVLHTGLVQDLQQGLGHLGGGITGRFAQPYQQIAGFGRVGPDLALRRAVHVAGLLDHVDQVRHILGGNARHHGLGAAFPDEQRGLEAGHAVVGAGSAQHAFVHGLGGIGFQLHAAGNHAHQQALGPGSVGFLAGHQLYGAEVAAHPAKAARVRVFLGFLAKHRFSLLIGCH